MKAILVSLAMALFFTVGAASAGSDATQGGSQYESGCSHNKWQDT